MAGKKLIIYFSCIVLILNFRDEKYYVLYTNTYGNVDIHFCKTNNSIFFFFNGVQIQLMSDK